MPRSRSSSTERGGLRRELLQEFSELSPLVAAERLARPTARLRSQLEAAGADRLQLILDSYESRSVDARARKRTGVFYTPTHVIDAMLDRLPAEGEWLDPAAGAGAFLVALAKRHGPSILDRLSACDVDRQALDVAALALEVALGAEHRPSIHRWRRTRAHSLDFLRDEYPGNPPDVIVGNPPYGLEGGADLQRLFPELGGEVDLYACFLLRSAAVAQSGGTIALLVPDTWLTNLRAAGLRSALARRGVRRIVDFGKPFATARDTRVHAVVLQRDAPVCAVESLRGGGLIDLSSVTSARLHEDAPRGWFLYRTTSEAAACARIEEAPALGSALDVLYGLRTGDNALHVVDGKGAAPLVAGRDLGAFDRAPSSKGLRASAERFAGNVRRQTGRWKIGIQRIRTNSKAPWRRWVEAALLSPDEVGLDSLTLVADRESAAEPSDLLLHVLGVLNSSILNRWYRLTFTDVNVKPIYIESLPIPPLSPEVVALVRRRLASPGAQPLERAIDRLVAHAYGLDEQQLQCLEQGFWETHHSPLPSLEEASRMSSPGDRRRAAL